MARSMLYLSVLRKLRVPGAAPLAASSLPTMHPVPTVLWLINVYVRDALTRLDETRARVTSIFGDLLKMDSTKKITKKLAGGAAGTAAWVTNVGNEYGQVLMSVLTAAEGGGLVDMAWYREAGKAPPRVLYVDRDCCATVGQCQTSKLFHEWHELVVRLDVWHLMRRFARGVTTDSHQLYGLFMARLSFAIFEWDAEDVSRLRGAKQSEEGRDAQEVKLSAKELARHCRRRTRGCSGGGAAGPRGAGHLLARDGQHGRPFDRPRPNGGDLEHAAPTPRLNPGPCGSGPLHQDGRAHQRRGEAPRLPVRPRLHFPGIVPPAPVPLHPRTICK
ncbi:uncharacterized protein LOC127360984 isoform X2 [Dicentrarchus labrax]|uniref:uncharacterized protein LOC127360984 isoform X1 n=1 Tax=Dicentrarchus labrax TaxID=13489 RepID=UPI0021F640C1|nr:uncharacterized protein LOC127360984 isoform X1 [Dicentrarchus labrax]XP_051251507.1 uncharacterized protein LOC127360984 isoform X1 [Dicentrarchus labrax]XP_051251508.1 uncharacterized protein LOC127360984 isoform X2 [Dicentrarchus labrax]